VNQFRDRFFFFFVIHNNDNGEQSMFCHTLADPSRVCGMARRRFRQWYLDLSPAL
jgi:hypothetical protein